MQVRAAEAELRHELLPPNSWMEVLHFNVLTSCPKDELHQWFIGLYGEHIIPAIVHSYTQVLQRPDLFTLDRNGDKHALVSNEAVARVFKRLADRLLKFTGDRIRFLMLALPLAVRDLLAPEVYPLRIYTSCMYVICKSCSKCMYALCRYILCMCKSYTKYTLSLFMLYAKLK